MKKLILFIGLLTGGSLYGQDDLFDIGKHLDKKNAREKNKIISPATKKIRYQNLPSTPLTGKLSNGDIIYTLPQDNMPCIITDIRKFNMPNLYEAGSNYVFLQQKNFPGRIPNAARRIPLITAK